MSNNKDFKVKNGIKPTVYHEAVVTVVSRREGYNLAGASYDGISFSVATQEAAPYAISFNNTGTKMYVIGSNNGSVFQYSLSTAYDLTTASYDSISFSVAAQESLPTDITFSADGTNMYTVSFIGDTVFQYGLTTPFNVGTASYSSISFSVASQATAPASVLFNTSGTKMYILDDATDTIYQYTLSTAWNVSTASYDTVSFNLAPRATSTYGFAFKPDGTRLFISDSTSDTVYQYALTAPYDISTLVYSGNSLNVSSQGGFNPSIIFNGDGTKLFLLGQNTDTIYQYSTVQNTATLDLSTGSVFEITPTSDLQVTLSNPADSGTVSGATLLLDGGASVAATSYDIANGSFDNKTFSLATQSNNNRGVVISEDGTKFFVMARGIDSVTQYTMSTAFDVSTASYNTSYNVGTQTVDQGGLFIGDSGTKLYIVDSSSYEVEQYTLSTPWNIGTASYANKTANIADVGGGSKYGITFKPDGTKLYITEASSFGRVGQYTLSTAWDVSTASFDTSYQASAQSPFMYDVALNSSGTKLFLLAPSNVYQYSLSTAWDVSTASYDSVTLDLSGQMTGANGLSFGNSGSFLVVVDNGSDDVNQYTVGLPATPATITYDTAIQWAGGTAPTSPAIGETDVLTFSTRDGGTTYNAALAIDGAQ